VSLLKQWKLSKAKVKFALDFLSTTTDYETLEFLIQSKDDPNYFLEQGIPLLSYAISKR
jgi:hypothetical protein